MAGSEVEPDLLTSPGTAVGTVAYMSPEQALGKDLDARTDLFSLGVVLYEMATGRPPFRGETGFELTSAILNQPLPRLPSSIPAPLAGVIDRCLAKEPEERYQQSTEVRAALEAVASGQAGTAWRVVLRRRRGLLRVARMMTGPAGDLSHIRMQLVLEPDAANPHYVITVRGRGYKLVEG